MSVSAVQRIWRKHNIRPQWLQRHMVSNDSDFETKAADVIGLYLKPPAHAAVFCVDEKTAIQALDRKDRMLPLSPGRAESHGFEYKRNGTLSLFAALNTATGAVLGKTAPSHTSGRFVAFLTDIVASRPEQRKIHVICDNVGSHKTQRVQDFLAQHRSVQMHFTPTYSRGSTRSRTGSLAFSATWSAAASSPRSKTSAESRCAASESTTRLHGPSSGSTTIHRGEFARRQFIDAVD